MSKSYRVLHNIFLFSILLSILVSCSSSRVVRLTRESFPPNTSGKEIPLFKGTFDRPVKEIAVIDSFTAKELTDATKQSQMDQIKTIAAKLGADAVHKVSIQQENIKGYVRDEQVPFQSYKQGIYQNYFIRGTAVKFLDNKGK